MQKDAAQMYECLASVLDVTQQEASIPSKSIDMIPGLAN